MRRLIPGLAAAAFSISLAAAAPAPAPLAIEKVGKVGDFPIDPGSLAWANGVTRKSSGEGRKIAPDLYWTGGPSTTESYVVVLENQTVRKDGAPFVHWLIWGVPDVKVPEGGEWETPPPDLRFGRNSAGTTGYAAPKAAKGEKQVLALQVFALDVTPKLPDGATREQVIAAMKGHVLGAGKIEPAYEGGKPF